MKIFEINYKMFDDAMYKKEKVLCTNKKKLLDYYKQFSIVDSIVEVKKEEFLVL